MIVRTANIYRSRTHEEVVQMLAGKPLPNSDRQLFPTIRELLCFAALLGFSEQRRVPLDREKGVEDVSYQQFERGDAEDLIYLIAVADSNDTNILREGEEARCAQIFEEYANGGLAIIKDALLQDGAEYPDRSLMSMLRERGYLKSGQPEPDLDKVTF